MSEAIEERSKGSARMTSTSSERRQLSDEVADDLRNRILTGALVAGEALRVEHLAAELGVSATPVREAMQILRSEGFLDLAPRRGFTVATLTSQDILQVFRARALISGELAALSAARIDEAKLRELEELQSVIIRAFRARLHRQVEAEVRRFHRLIDEGAEAPRLRWSLDALSRFVPRHFYAHLEGDEEMTDVDHSELLVALRERDAVAARAVMERHVEASGRLLADYFEARRRER